MQVIKRILEYCHKYGQRKEYLAYSRVNSIYDYDVNFLKLLEENDVNYIYSYMHHYFHQRAPKLLGEHRKYFRNENRGFGEDAFHAMWWLLLLYLKPKKMLEIGIYRGQVISLWALISRYLNYATEIHGISPFSSLGDSVSRYLKDFDYLKDIRGSFRFWQLDSPVLVKALSTDSLAIAHIQKHIWDLIYIDGSHDFEIALCDYKLCRDNLKVGGILVLDDASVGSSFRPPSFSFAGHPGPSRVAREFADKEMQFLGMVGHNNIFKKK